jgi:hypothetical protein
MPTHVHRRGCRGPASTLPVLLLLTALTVGWMPAHAQSQTCRTRCQPRVLEPAFVEIDANTGEVLSGATSFSDHEKVQVVVVRRNPFKYAYRTQVKASPLDTALVGFFLNLIPGANLFNFPGLPSAPAMPQAIGPQPAAPPPPPPHCNGGSERLNELTRSRDQLETEYGLAKIEAGKTQAAHEGFLKFVADTDKENLGDVAACEAICRDAEGVVQNLATLTDTKALQERLEGLTASAEALGKQVDAFRALFPNCGFDARLNEISGKAVVVKVAAQGNLEKLEALKKAKPAIENMGKIINRALADDNAVSEQHFPYTQGDPTSVKVTLFRKNLREDNAQEKEVGQVDLTVGRSRFSLSGGVGFSTIEDVTIVNQGGKFAEENESDLRPSLTLMLNAQLGRFWKKDDREKNADERPRATRTSWGISTGLVLTSRNNSTEAEFIAGPNLGLLDDRFVIVLGYHAARVASLGGGYKIGEDIPDDVTTIPVDRDWKSGAMLAFTYKIR